jgi:hypothetical protein
MMTSASISLPEKAVMISAIAADVRLKDSDVRVAVVLLFNIQPLRLPHSGDSRVTGELAH